MAKFIEVICLVADTNKLEKMIAEEIQKKIPKNQEDDELTDEQYRIITGEERHPKDEMIEIKIDQVPLIELPTSINVDKISYYEPDNDVTVVYLGDTELVVNMDYEDFDFEVHFTPPTWFQIQIIRFKLWLGKLVSTQK